MVLILVIKIWRPAFTQHRFVFTKAKMLVEMTTVEVARKVGPSALVAFEGNTYSVPPGLVGADVSVRHRLGSPGIEIVSASGARLAEHRREAPGMGAHHA